MQQQFHKLIVLGEHRENNLKCTKHNITKEVIFYKMTRVLPS